MRPGSSWRVASATGRLPHSRPKATKASGISAAAVCSGATLRWDGSRGSASPCGGVPARSVAGLLQDGANPALQAAMVDDFGALVEQAILKIARDLITGGLPTLQARACWPSRPCRRRTSRGAAARARCCGQRPGDRGRQRPRLHMRPAHPRRHGALRRELREDRHHLGRRRCLAAAADRGLVEGLQDGADRRRRLGAGGARLRARLVGRARARADGGEPATGGADRVDPPQAVRATKRLLREGRHASLANLLQLSATAQAIAHTSGEHREALARALARP